MQGCSRFMANRLLAPQAPGVGAWNPRQRRGYRGLGDTASIPDWSSCGGALLFRTGVKVTPGHGRLSHFGPALESAAGWLA
jgi:hypothetical protein